jgi:hypothetical protein
LYSFLEKRYLLPDIATVVANEIFLGEATRFVVSNRIQASKLVARLMQSLIY